MILFIFLKKIFRKFTKKWVKLLESHQENLVIFHNFLGNFKNLLKLNSINSSTSASFPPSNKINFIHLITSTRKLSTQSCIPPHPHKNEHHIENFSIKFLEFFFINIFFHLLHFFRFYSSTAEAAAANFHSNSMFHELNT